MSKNAKEYEFWILTSGKGVLEAGKKLGKIQVKSKNNDIKILKEKAYEQLAPSVINPYMFNLKLIKGEN